MMSKPRLQVQTMKTSDLIPYARNAKQHPDEQVAQIAASIPIKNCGVPRMRTRVHHQ